MKTTRQLQWSRLFWKLTPSSGIVKIDLISSAFNFRIANAYHKDGWNFEHSFATILHNTACVCEYDVWRFPTEMYHVFVIPGCRVVHCACVIMYRSERLMYFNINIRCASTAWVQELDDRGLLHSLYYYYCYYYYTYTHGGRLWLL